MKRDTLLTISVVILLVLNIGTLGYLFLSKGEHHPPHFPPPPSGEMPPPPRRPDELIRQTLQLSEEQDKKYVASIEVHHSGMVRLDSVYRVTAEDYFKLLLAKNGSSLVGDSLVRKLGRVQAEKAAITYKHLEEIKGFCTSSQSAKFDSIIPDIVRMLLLPQRRPPPPPGMLPPPRRN